MKRMMSITLSCTIIMIPDEVISNEDPLKSDTTQSYQNEGNLDSFHNLHTSLVREIE